MLLYLLVFTINCKTISLFIICIILSLSNVRLSETAIYIFPSSLSFHLSHPFLFSHPSQCSWNWVLARSPVVHLIPCHWNSHTKLFGLNLYWFCGLTQLIRYLQRSICFLMKCREPIITFNPLQSWYSPFRHARTLVFFYFCVGHNLSNEKCRPWLTHLISLKHRPSWHDKQICPAVAVFLGLTLSWFGESSFVFSFLYLWAACIIKLSLMTQVVPDKTMTL